MDNLWFVLIFYIVGIAVSAIGLPMLKKETPRWDQFYFMTVGAVGIVIVFYSMEWINALLDAAL